MAQNPYGIWQSGDGRRYKVHSGMVRQLAASAVTAYLKNKYSTVESTTSPTGWFWQTKTFKSVKFDRKTAESQADGLLRSRYGEFWTDFQGSGPAAVNKLLQFRRHASLHADGLQAKFKEAADTNAESLGALDRNLAVARAVRDGGFTCVAAMATGGVGAGAITASTGGAIIVGGATVKAGSKFYDLSCEGKLSDGMSVGLITVDFASDLMFGAVGLTQQATKEAAMTAKQTFLFLMCTKVPLEMAKTAAGGGSMAQIALAGGFEAAGPLFDKFKDAFGGCLIPGLTKVTVTASIDGALSAVKDMASISLASSPPAAGGASLLEAIYAFFAAFNMDDKTFIERYVVVPV